MNKLKLIGKIDGYIEGWERAKTCIREMEVGRVYTWKIGSRETCGVLETFNKQSIRFRVLASEKADTYSNKRTRDLRRNITSVGYAITFIRAKRTDLLTLVGLEFVSDELARLFNGTATGKYLWD